MTTNGSLSVPLPLTDSSESSRAATFETTGLRSSSDRAATPEYDSRWSRRASRGNSCTCSNSARSTSSEQTARGELGRPVAAPPARPASARLRLVDRLGHGGDRGVPVVAMVPAEAEAAARTQHAVDLRQRQLELEPVQAGAGHDRIRHPVAERDRLGRTLHSFEPEPTKDREHPRIRLDRDDTRPERGDRPRQLPRAGAELDDELRAVGDEPARRLLRPLRPRALVGVGVRAEGQPPGNRRHAGNLVTAGGFPRSKENTTRRFNLHCARVSGRTWPASPQTEPVTRPAQRPRLVFFYSPVVRALPPRRGLHRPGTAAAAQPRHVRPRPRPRSTGGRTWRRSSGSSEVPTICVVEDRKLRCRIVAPRGCRELEQRAGAMAAVRD